MILYVAWITIIYVILAAVVLLAAGVAWGKVPNHGIIGDLFSVVTDSRFILVFSWSVAGLTLVSLRR